MLDNLKVGVLKDFYDRNFVIVAIHVGCNQLGKINGFSNLLLCYSPVILLIYLPRVPDGEEERHEVAEGPSVVHAQHQAVTG